MSRHTPRHERWNKRGPSAYTWGGASVRYHRGAWYAWVSYRLRPSESTAAADADHHRDTLGPFKRPRNAMMAAEERVRLLGRQHGDRISFDADACNP
jgi:hypothetical protein